MRLENWFPYKQLAEKDTRTIIEMCGGPPLTRVEHLAGFFQYLALPMLRDSMVKQLMVVGARACAETFDIEPARGETMFQRGALLYTGVLAEMSPFGKVPCEPDVWLNMIRTDIHEMTWTASERLESETSSFCAFMSEVSPALEVSEPIERHLAKAGAGMIHLITTESLRAEESRALEQEHPELADLEVIFRELDL